jgi:hypothetical protein
MIADLKLTIAELKRERFGQSAERSRQLPLVDELRKIMILPGKDRRGIIRLVKSFIAAEVGSQWLIWPKSRRPRERASRRSLGGRGGPCSRLGERSTARPFT